MDISCISCVIALSLPYLWRDLSIADTSSLLTFPKRKLQVEVEEGGGERHVRESLPEAQKKKGREGGSV